MDWILDHLQIIIAIAGAIAYWLNARKKEQAGEPADYDGDGKPDTHLPAGRSVREHADRSAEDENTRRVQEEIRRMIAERQGGGSRTTPPSSPMSPPPIRQREPELAPYAEEARREEAQHEAAVVLERQRHLAEQLAALQARRVEAGREAKAVWTEQAVPAPVSGSREDLSLLSELRNARSLRKAIVLREVLGAPVGLR